MQPKNSLVVGNYEVTVDKFLHYGSKIGCYYVENYHVIVRRADDIDETEQWPCTLRKIPSASADLRKMCENEGRIFSLLKDRGHPSAVQLLGQALVEHSSVTKVPLCDVFYLFSETERGSLWEFIQEQKTSGRPLPEEKIMRIAINIVDMVALLHSSEPPLIHRNITPRNIIETTSGVFKLSSFISVAFAPPRRFRTSELLPLREDLACFTAPMYRSPEMMDLNTEAGITTHSDIWSIGVLLHILCYGKHPFEGESTEQIRQGEMPPRPHCNSYPTVESLIGNRSSTEVTIAL
ncbi:hypothetical protein FRC00_012155 [Tulasnella sp. 408]|nr:hypothetical protein FRC00_012155 [Tulasnella sp. 408]